MLPYDTVLVHAPLTYVEDFPGSTVVNNPAAGAGGARDVGLVPGRGDAVEKEMATHSSILAWKVPWTEEPGGLQSVGSQSVGRTECSAAAPYSSCVCLSTHLSVPVFRHTTPG